MEKEPEQPRLDSWDDFAGEYLKADLIKEFPCPLAVKDVKAGYEDGRAKLVIVVEYNSRDWKIDLNKTNQTAIRAAKIKSPKEIIGKKLTFVKIKQRNPTTNTMVDSLLIESVE